MDSEDAKQAWSDTRLLLMNKEYKQQKQKTNSRTDPDLYTEPNEDKDRA